MNFPEPPIDTFPHAVIDLPYFKTRALTWPFEEVRGSMLADKTDGSGMRWYQFEIEFNSATGRWRAAKVSPGDASNSQSFDNRGGRGREITGFDTSVRPRLKERAKMAAEKMRTETLEQREWLLDLFKTAQPVNVVSRQTGKPPNSTREYAVHSGWLIVRQEIIRGPDAWAMRLSADDGTRSLIVRP
jgi:hypothetical protein